MSKKATDADTILEAAIELAEQSSWEKIHLHQVAEKLKIPLDAIHQHYRQKDDLVEAWYDRADSAMLETSASSEFIAISVRQRLHMLIMAWLDYLARHKKVSTDMLLYKLEPGHIHLQLKGLLRISRTVQWLREAAFINSTHMQRIAEEVSLSAIFINTFVYWMFDHSENHTRTRKFLDKKLSRAEKIARTFFNRKPMRPKSRSAASPG